MTPPELHNLLKAPSRTFYLILLYGTLLPGALLVR
jgi:hypothetical protein